MLLYPEMEIDVLFHTGGLHFQMRTHRKYNTKIVLPPDSVQSLCTNTSFFFIILVVFRCKATLDKGFVLNWTDVICHKPTNKHSLAAGCALC